MMSNTESRSASGTNPLLVGGVEHLILGLLSPGQAATKGSAAYGELRRAIVTHELPSLAPLDEGLLLSHFDYGRTPLREALKRLAHEKLLAWPPRQAPIIRDIAIEDLPRVYETRLMIEPEIAVLAARRATPADHERLHQFLDLLSDASTRGDVYASVELDFGLHAAIAGATRNQYLRELSVGLNQQSLRMWYRGQRALGIGTVDRLHRDLVDAICAGEEHAARALAADHVTRFFDRQQEMQRLEALR